MKQSRNSGLKPWKPGESGNPLGRPAGARSKFSEAAAQDVLADWLEHGTDVLATVRKEKPAEYLRCVLALVPRDIAIAIHNDGPYSAEERRMVRRLLDAIETSGAAAGVDIETVFAKLIMVG